MRKVLLATALIGALTMTEGARAQDKEPRFTGSGGGDRIVGASYATRAPVLGQNGMAATAQPLATQIAIDILKAGGSAVDAAIAANAALGLMEPVGCGLGGDLFAIVWDPKTRKLHGLNASGRSPKGRTLEDLKHKLGAKTSIPSYGSLPITVPGAADGWFELHGKFGKLPMGTVLAPATRYAREGFPVSQLIAYYWARSFKTFEKNKNQIEELDNARATYLIDGKAPVEAQIFKNPDLARTYDLLARVGRDAYYKGEIARTIDTYMRRIGGDLRYEDFAAHVSEWVEPAHVNYRGYDVYELPPNTQGVAALQMLQMLSHFDLKKMGFGSADATHVMAEAKRLAFEDVAKYYADPQFAKIPLKGLLDPAYAAARAKLIGMGRANPNVGPGEPKLGQGDTTYLTVADKDGMMVSLIQSNYRGMGSGLVADGLGFMFQDRGELFSLDPGHANVYAPGKRPFHTIIPAFVMKDGAPFLSLGLMGGDMQPQGHVQILVNMIDFGLNVQEAGDAARWHHDGGSEPTGQKGEGIGTLELESGYSADVAAILKRRGFTISNGSGGYGGYQAIQWDPVTRVYRGASEMRKDGAAMGY
jgi:gamma-glutamyltranspeptidase/glutathione hydrolase